MAIRNPVAWQPLVTTVLLSVATLAWSADPKVNRGEERRESAQARQAQQQVRQAEDKLATSKRELRRAQAKVAEASLAHKQSVQRVKQLRDELELKHEPASGTARAREAHHAAKSELDRLSAPLLARLRDQPAYQAATKSAEESKAKLRSLADDNTLSEDQRAERAGILSQTSLEPSRLERAAIDADPLARRAHEKLASAAEAVAAAVAKLQQLVDRDPQLRQALSELERSADQQAAAERQVGAALRQANQAAEHLQREQAQLKQLVQRQRLDDLRDRQRRDNSDGKKGPEKGKRTTNN